MMDEVFMNLHTPDKADKNSYTLSGGRTGIREPWEGFLGSFFLWEKEVQISPNHEFTANTEFELTTPDP